jgi:hypothetical protein
MNNQNNDDINISKEEERLVDVWGRRNPRFEKQYEDSVMRVLSDYGFKASEQTEAKAKIFGPAYEVYILAFFIGLYSGKRLPLSEDPDDLKVLGQPLDKWGNLSTKAREAYPEIRRYILYALVAKTDVDWLEVDKGNIKLSQAVAKLINTMEEYANYGFSFMEDKLKQEGYFFSPRAFLDIFLQLTDKADATKTEEDEDDSDVEQL